MALKKNFPTPQEMTAGYHKIGVVEIDVIAKKLTVVVYGYTSKATADKGGIPLIKKQHVFDAATAPQAVKDAVSDFKAGIYPEIKALDFWTGATDDVD